MFEIRKKDYNCTYSNDLAKRSPEDERGKGAVCANLICRRKLNSKYFATISGFSRPKNSPKYPLFKVSYFQQGKINRGIL
jgi:hypothetical protein